MSATEIANQSNEHLLTPYELAARWRCSIQTLKRRRKEGALKCCKLGGALRFRLEDVIEAERLASK